MNLNTNSEVYKRRMALRKQKISIKDIAQIEGVSKQAVQQSIGKTGRLVKRPERHPERNRMIEEALLSGKKTTQIAGELGMSHGAIYRIGKRAGVIKPVNVNRFLIPLGKFRCTGKCHKVKKLSEYGINRTEKHGRMRVCKKCNSKNVREAYRRRKLIKENNE